MKNSNYVDQITSEMIPDDTLDLLKGTRKGKSDVKALDHIVGVSDLATIQKAKDQRRRAVTIGKTGQMQRSFMALGVYLRKFFIDQIDKQDQSIDTQSFGKFTIVEDPDADPDALYSKKIVYEPTGILSQVTGAITSSNNTSNFMLNKTVDFSRVSRLCRVQNQTLCKKNLEHMANHLAQLVVGKSSDSEMFRGKCNLGRGAAR